MSGCRWTGDEEELLVSMVQSIEDGRVLRAGWSWAEIAQMMTERARELGIDMREYTTHSVSCHYFKMPKEPLEPDPRSAAGAAAAAAAAQGGSVVVERPITLPPMGRSDADGGPPALHMQTCEPATKATGPLEDFAKYNGREGKGKGKEKQK